MNMSEKFVENIKNVKTHKEEIDNWLEESKRQSELVSTWLEFQSGAKEWEEVNGRSFSTVDFDFED